MNPNIRELCDDYKHSAASPSLALHIRGVVFMFSATHRSGGREREGERVREREIERVCGEICALYKHSPPEGQSTRLFCSLYVEYSPATPIPPPSVFSLSCLQLGMTPNPQPPATPMDQCFPTLHKIKCSPPPPPAAAPQSTSCDPNIAPYINILITANIHTI